MGIRTRLDELLGDKFGDVRERIREKLPLGLKTILQDALQETLQDFRQNPRLIGGLVEETSPWLSRQVLGAASNFAEPFLAAMGLSIVELGEESITVSMPGWLRNQGELGTVHFGALCTLAEFSSRIYWEHHLDLRRSEMILSGMQVRPVGGTNQLGLNHLKGTLKARYHIAIAERENVLHHLRASGVTELESNIAVYDEGQKLVCEVQLEWRFKRQLSLAPRADAKTGKSAERENA